MEELSGTQEGGVLNPATPLYPNLLPPPRASLRPPPSSSCTQAGVRLGPRGASDLAVREACVARQHQREVEQAALALGEDADMVGPWVHVGACALSGCGAGGQCAAGSPVAGIVTPPCYFSGERAWAARVMWAMWGRVGHWPQGEMWVIRWSVGLHGSWAPR